MILICKGVVRLTVVIFPCVAAMMTAGAATNEVSAAAYSPPQIAVLTTTNSVGESIATNVVCVPGITNIIPCKVVYPDAQPDDFIVEDWAEELAEKAEQGLHIKNGLVLVVVRLKAGESEYRVLTKVRAKFCAVEFLRYYYPNLPERFSSSCRILVNEQSDSNAQCVVVMSFALTELQKRS